MTTLFKKTLLATAVFAVAGVANAAVLEIQAPAGTKATTPGATDAWYTASLDGLLNKTGKEVALVADADTALPLVGVAGSLVLTYKSGAAIPVNDVVTIKFTGATFKTGATPALGLLADGGITTEAGAFEFIDIKDSNTARFRVTTAVTSGSTFNLTGITLAYGTIAANAIISAEVKAISQNTIIGEYDTKSQVLLTAKPQTTATAVGFDEKIATAKDRKTFAGAATDVATVTTVNNETAYAFSETVDAVGAKIVYTLKATNGDFSFVRDGDKTAFGGNNDGTLSSAEIAKSFNNAVNLGAGDDSLGYVLSADNKTITVTQTGVNLVAENLNEGAVAFTLSPLGEATSTRASASVLGELTVAADVKFVNAAGTTEYVTATGLDLGKLVLDGSVVRVPFFPIQEGKWSGVVRVANSSSQDGAIKLDIYDVDGTAVVTNYTASVTSKKNSSVNLYADILAALKSKSVDTIGKLNQLSVTVVTEVPANNVQVYSAFTDESNKNRYIVNNDGKVQTK